ncbi:MAG: NAD(P)/FAD-dependent oxidoreductase [Gammaproteobacteria bacterium]|nr:NAD(P)/FAD-dependent oxidoreductase [Gammaproteobacteria bacterium]
MTEKYDAIVVGAGHNGLVCATLLARAGKNVLMLEANEQVGGAAITREFAEGYSVSACAHLMYQLQPEVRKELQLSPELSSKNMATIALGENGDHVRLSGNSVEGVERQDAANYRAFRKRMMRYAELLRKFFNKPPPRLGTKNFADLKTLGQLGFAIRRLGKNDMREFLRLIGMNIYDELDVRFENPLLKGAISLDAVLGTHLGPRSPNTIMTYLYRLAGDHARMAIPKGGMGTISDELAHTARGAGVTIRTGMPVARIVVTNGRVTGVESETGERFDSYTVISNADPKRTIMQLVGAKHVETGFTRRIYNLRAEGNAAKLHLALDGLPDFKGLKEKDFAQRILIAPDEHYVERAFNPAKYGESSTSPVVEMTFPSALDDALAPSGKHVLSAVVQYAPYALKGGWDVAAKLSFQQSIIDTIARYAPDIEERIVDSELLTPADIEREFHITGGHWHHAELTLDQFLFVRPVSGAAQYRMPLDGLYLCGAGTHPGGGVSGAAGRNAAHTILRREKVA